MIFLIPMLFALILANSPLADWYFNVLDFKFLSLSLHHWVNDGLMTVFFFLIGLEIKKELVEGELSSWKKASLPILAALGGVFTPALIYWAFNFDEPSSLSGWAIPTATDISLALAALYILKNRIPKALVTILLSIAVADDLSAVIIIATFYTQHIYWQWLGLAVFCAMAILIVRKFKFHQYFLYTLGGLIMWYGFLRSGVHATLTGVILGLMTPLTFHSLTGKQIFPVKDLIHKLETLVNKFILPIFIFTNTGIQFSFHHLNDLWMEPVFLGVSLGLFIGKPVGILSFSWIFSRLHLTEIPSRLRWGHIFGMAILAGIGFTMSIFISELSLDKQHSDTAKLAILLASLLSCIVGVFYLFRVTKSDQKNTLNTPE